MIFGAVDYEYASPKIVRTVLKEMAYLKLHSTKWQHLFSQTENINLQLIYFLIALTFDFTDSFEV